jgi:hypothetical protein
MVSEKEKYSEMHKKSEIMLPVENTLVKAMKDKKEQSR